jgi:hypothetical protein
MRRHAYDIGLDVKDCDVIIGVAGSLRHAGNIHGAMPAKERHRERASEADGWRNSARALRSSVSILIITPVVLKGFSTSCEEIVESAIIQSIEPMRLAERAREK